MNRLYKEVLSKGLLQKDPRQLQVVGGLGRLQNIIIPYDQQLTNYRSKTKDLELQIQRAEKRKQHDEQAKAFLESDPRAKLVFPRKPRGMYLHGNVGTGKTILMDMFYDTLDIENKRRTHLSNFMTQVHERIHEYKRSKDISPESDAISEVGYQLSQENTVLALDEFVITDVVDALILKHLFGVMFENGTVLVATSNTAVEDLYKDGLNYFYFKPFISLLKSHTKVVNIDSSLDYRLHNSLDTSSENRFMFPINTDTMEQMDECFTRLCEGNEQETTIKVAFGRTLFIPRAGNSVCRFTFKELCDDKEPILGTADFSALCENFDTIMIDNIPMLNNCSANAVRRFITLVDLMYDNGVNLVASGANDVFSLCRVDCNNNGQSDTLFSVKELPMALKRLCSRLVEMTCASF